MATRSSWKGGVGTRRPDRWYSDLDSAEQKYYLPFREVLWCENDLELDIAWPSIVLKLFQSTFKPLFNVLEIFAGE
jgi:hypothetical protein